MMSATLPIYPQRLALKHQARRPMRASGTSQESPLATIWHWLSSKDAVSLGSLLAFAHPFGLKLNLLRMSLVDRENPKLDEILSA